ncbi:MAG: FtsW/RodA/SpoVE family cell cycle protein [Eubacteriales bacterium]|nr:FtsW/RodA/SpoVE family cell cycle protein [Eubacteriales bacterium]
MDIINNIINGTGSFFGGMFEGLSSAAGSGDAGQVLYTMIARWVFIGLAAFILLRAIFSLLKSSSPAEVWAFMHTEDGKNIPVTHWENAIGRSKRSDIIISGPGVSRSHGTLTRDGEGNWAYMDLGSKNGAYINGERTEPYVQVPVKTGDQMDIGGVECMLYPMSIEERMNNRKIRENKTELMMPWSSIIALTVFQLMTMFQLMISLGDRYSHGITVSFIGMVVLMWAYTLAVRSMKRKGFEIETIAFFLSTLSLAAMATTYPNSVLKQFMAIVLGVVLFLFMCAVMRDLDLSERIKIVIMILAGALLLVNVFFGTNLNGQSNWVVLPGGLTIQPSELAKLAFIWVGASTMNQLFKRNDSIRFTIFSGFCFLCLAKMGDFGTALIFFVTFIVISFLRSGDFTKLIMIIGVAFVGGLMVLRFKSYVAQRFSVWGHVWENSAGFGYQQTRTMSAAASGGLVGVGAGNGWLHTLWASQTDLVFGMITEEWGLIISIMAILAIVTLTVFAYRSIWGGRSTFYTIAACAATTLFLFQTILNVFGSVDLLPLTGVTFPFVSAGGTSMISSWGLLAFLKAADTRQGASLAVSNSNKDLKIKKPGFLDWTKDVQEGGKHGA